MRKHPLNHPLGAALVVGMCCAGICGAAPQSATGQNGKSTDRTVWTGVYTAAQAQQGRAAYRAACGACHGEDLSAYQSILKGERFMDHWREDTLLNFFTTLKTTMPRNRPDSLSEGVYLDITAYILQENRFPAGSAALEKDDLPAVRVEGESGPAELPTGALAQLIGCLVKGPQGEWSLSLASAPKRTRDPEKSTAQQLTILDALPLGKRTFGLMDAAFQQPDSKLGHKVEAKGFLIRAPGNDRINLTSLETVAAVCTP